MRHLPAMGTGENTALIHHISEHLPVQVGGGIRTVEAASKMLQAGAKKVIIGSAARSRRGSILRPSR